MSGNKSQGHPHHPVKELPAATCCAAPDWWGGTRGWQAAVVVGEWHAADQSLLCTLRCGVVVAVMSILSGMTVPAVTSTLSGQLGAFPGNGILYRS